MQAPRPASAASPTVEFVVERAFYFEGKVLEKGKTVPLPRVFAIEMEAAHKGHIKVIEVKPAQPAAPTAAPAPAKGKDDVEKGNSNARK